jgi:serine protease Do
MLVAGASAAALFLGFAAAPTLTAVKADARQIVVQPPQGAPMSFADLVERVSPAVVSIQVRTKPQTSEGPGGGELPPGFEEFLRRNPEFRQQRREGQSLGSGFFIAENGAVVTNHHVVDDAVEITVRTSDRKEHKAEVVGTDVGTDLAVLRIKDTKGQRFPFVAFDRSASTNVRVGDWVVAVGNPFGLDGTATAGIVSAKGRREGGSSYVDFLQIDAPINRGNSGGPTFDLQGRVIGVNSAIFSPTGGNIGIGFAIPADTAAAVVDQLQRSGKVTRGWLGVEVQPLDATLAKSLGLNEAKGAMVASVRPNAPAAKAGIREGDVILTVNGAQVEDSRDLTRKVGGVPVGSQARFEILRDGRRLTLPVVLAERPSERVLAGLGDGEDKSGGESSGEAGVVRQAGLGLDVRSPTSSDRERLSLAPGDTGLVVAELEPDSDLARKGLREGDMILEAGGKAVRTASDLTDAVAVARKESRPVLLKVRTQNGRSRFVAADLKPS